MADAEKPGDEDFEATASALVVDFKALMNPEALARHERVLRHQLQNLEADTPIILADAVHAYHNCGRQTHAETYETALQNLLVPELIRRLAGGRLPAKCPTCSSPIDWPIPESTGKLTVDEVTLLREAVTAGGSFVRIVQLSQWNASKRLVGRGFLRRDPKDVHRVQATDEGVRENDKLGVGWWEGS